MHPRHKGRIQDHGACAKVGATEVDPGSSGIHPEIARHARVETEPQSRNISSNTVNSDALDGLVKLSNERKILPLQILRYAIQQGVVAQIRLIQHAERIA